MIDHVIPAEAGIQGAQPCAPTILIPRNRWLPADLPSPEDAGCEATSGIAHLNRSHCRVRLRRSDSKAIGATRWKRRIRLKAPVGKVECPWSWQSPASWVAALDSRVNDKQCGHAGPPLQRQFIIRAISEIRGYKGFSFVFLCASVPLWYKEILRLRLRMTWGILSAWSCAICG